MFVVDIETAPDTRDEQYTVYKSTALADKRKKGDNFELDRMDRINDEFPLHPLTGQVTCIGIITDRKFENMDLFGFDTLPFLEGYNNPVWYVILSQADKDEKSLISTFWNIYDILISEGNKMVTYNGLEFDLPFLIRRSMMLGIDPPKNGVDLSRYNNDSHLDLFQVLHSYKEIQRFKFISQHEWAYRFGIVDTISDGENKAVEYFLVKDWSALISHCLSDIVKTFLIYQRMKGWVYHGTTD